MKYSVQIVGVGGQGVLTASMILGTAAMNAGYKVAMSEVHGMAQRGGSVLSTVRFGDDVYSPLEAKGGSNLLIGFEPLETVRSLNLVNKDSQIVMNLDPVLPGNVAAGFEEYPSVSDLVNSVKERNSNLSTISATTLAEKAGKSVVANAVIIGAIAAVKGFPLSKDHLKDALLSKVPPKTKELNEKAFELGYENASKN